MEVIQQKKNPLMKREEAWLRIEHAGKPTPTRKDIISQVSKHFKAKDDCVIVDKIFSEAGSASSKIKVLVYQKKEDVPKAKMDKMKIRMKLMKKGEEGKPAGEAPAKPEASPPNESKDADKDKPDEKPGDAEKKEKAEK